MSDPDSRFENLTPRQIASILNGRKSKGPVTKEGKEKSSKNAVKHGLKALIHFVSKEEGWGEFAMFEDHLRQDLGPESAMEEELLRRISRSMWLLYRADRMEVEWFNQRLDDGGDFGLALVRDCNNANVLSKITRYRGGLDSSIHRNLKMLRTLIKERRARETDAMAAGLAVPVPVKAYNPHARELAALGPEQPYAPRIDVLAVAAARKRMAIEPNEPGTTIIATPTQIKPNEPNAGPASTAPTSKNKEKTTRTAGSTLISGVDRRAGACVANLQGGNSILTDTYGNELT